MGQVPTMFYTPDAPVVNTDAVTIPDTELQTMFPEQFEAETVVVPERPCFLCTATGWVFAGAALVVLWAMRKPRR